MNKLRFSLLIVATSALLMFARPFITHSFASIQNPSYQLNTPVVHLAAQKTQRRARGIGYARTFVFDPRRHRWYAYEQGRLIRSGRASGGSHYCRDIKRACRTPSGVFRITRKGTVNCRSSRYPRPHGGARMSHCMFFSAYYAIHGSGHVPVANVSHGCIRVLPSDARWLHRNFIRIGTKVIVRSY